MGAAAGLLGTGANMAGTMMEASARQRAQKQQEENIRNYHIQQMLFQHQEKMRQAALRGQARGAYDQNIYDTASGQAQMANQLKEQERLSREYARGTSAAATPASDASIQAGGGSAALTGQSGGDKEFRSDLARRLNNAASDARGRIGALATMNSYGNSQFGLGNVVPIGFQKAGWDINKLNNFRRGSLAAYGVEKQIEPVQVQYRGSPGATAVKGLGGLLGGLGGGMSGGGGGGLF